MFIAKETHKLSVIVFCLLLFVIPNYLPVKGDISSDEGICLIDQKYNDCGESPPLKQITSTSTTSKLTVNKDAKYLLYDVIPSEGFNLRRDVYLRLALIAKKLGPDWILVLPPWELLYHWKQAQIRSDKLSSSPKPYKLLPWSTFFNLTSLSYFTPVIEFDDYLKISNSSVDTIVSFSHYENNFKGDGDYKFRERVKIGKCPSSGFYSRLDDGKIQGWFWSMKENFTAKSLYCAKLEGFTSTVVSFIEKNFNKVTSIMITGAEVILHSDYGEPIFWSARQSMRFSNHLIDLGNQFRKNELSSWDEEDRTILEPDWRQMKKKNVSARGGLYIGAHIRRRDFAQYRPDKVPELFCAAFQTMFASRVYDVKTVYIATDADDQEWEKLVKILMIDMSRYFNKVRVVRYQNDSLEPGELAIVDQWICAHAIAFIGTEESTFTFRIQEEREILGFPSERTFITFCPNCSINQGGYCKQESQWKIKYE